MAFHATLFTSSASRLLFITYEMCRRQTSNAKERPLRGQEGELTYTSRAFLHCMVSTI